MTTIATQLLSVRQRIFLACQAAGRDPQSVSLLAVSKTFAADAVQEAIDAGQRCFGENYIQEAVDKIAAFSRSSVPATDAAPAVQLQWHCIGPIQSNKTRLVAENFDWVHTVDRLKIAERLSAQRPPGMAPLNVCIQLNVDGGVNKSGVLLQDAAALIAGVSQLANLRVRGLMSIPEPTPDYAAQIAVHLQVKAFFDEVKAQQLPGLEAFDTLSMGMTGDLEAAIHAGSTMVRVGTGIFGGRPRAATPAI